MTPLSQNILESYQHRKTKKQKFLFISLLKQHFPQLQVQESPKCRNVILGDIENAQIVLAAYYNTCPLHSVSANHSGIVILCELLCTLTGAQRAKAAFVFIDRKGAGLSYFRSQYKEQLADKLLVSFDCVSNGDTILIAATKQARAAMGDVIKCSFPQAESKAVLLAKAEKFNHIVSQTGFQKAITVVALRPRRYIGYYVDRFRTNTDTEFDKENIKLICDGILNLLKSL